MLTLLGKHIVVQCIAMVSTVILVQGWEQSLTVSVQIDLLFNVVHTSFSLQPKVFWYCANQKHKMQLQSSPGAFKKSLIILVLGLGHGL